MSKDRIKKFWIWMRNGVSIFFTWLTLLWLILSIAFGVEKLLVTALLQLLVFVIGGVFLFTLLFSDIVIRRLGFVGRLTGFMLLFSVYEGICFYLFGLFHGRGSFTQWLIFAGIIVILYFVCIGIFRIYSRQKETEYTQALQRYQQKQNRNTEESRED